jgi:hypothetical protein
MMEQCQSLKVLSLVDLKMDENHCRVLGAYSRPALEISLVGCTITSAGAITLAEVLGRNQGPTKLEWCKIDIFLLARGLRGKSSLKSLRLRIFGSPEDGNRKLLAIAGALKENKALVDLELLHDFWISDESWDAVCDSLKAHPTLKVLHFFRAIYGDATMAPTVLKSRIQTLVDILKVNMSIHTIQLGCQYYEHGLYQELVIPYLETNRFRPRIRAIQKTRPIAYRAKVLGRALLAVKTDPNRLWMLLSGNVDATGIAAAANLPTPTTAAATINAAVVAATAAATAAVTVSGTITDGRATSTIGASAGAAANVATPNAFQKRKARP